jgi:hypothetical protein
MRAKNLVLFLVCSLVVVACSSATGAPQAIEGYVRALADKDVIAASSSACLEWEESAFAEASSFEAVEVTIEGLSCSEKGTQAAFTLVQCEGKIIADYGGELQDIDLSLRTYLAIIDQGEWKMCGYAAN